MGWRQFFWLLPWLIFLNLQGSFAIEPLHSARRIHAHLLIGDAASACSEAAVAQSDDPDSLPLQEAYIEALGAHGDEKGMLAQWEELIATHPDYPHQRKMIEKMAWSVIEKGEKSSSPITRIMTLLAAFFAQDARGVLILDRGMQDESLLVRKAATQLAAQMRDARLCDRIFQLCQEESAWHLRLEAIKALGQMKILSAKAPLAQWIDAVCNTDEERVAAIISLAHLSEDAQEIDLQKLATSRRAALRSLFCQIVAHFELYEDALITPLLKDPHAEVRRAAVDTLGHLRSCDPEVLVPSLNDLDPLVAITAAWALTLEGRGELFKQWLHHNESDVRIAAAGALAATGKYGVDQMKQAFKTTDDPFVRMNVAIGLLRQRIWVPEACTALYQGFIEESERWMWKEVGTFRVLAPSTIKHSDTIPNMPEGVNQITRLEIINILAIMEYPKAKSAIKHFLAEKRWGISGMASALLLTEGEEEAILLVRSLLKDPNPKVRIQAALILALWGQDATALQTLENAYPDADREMKESILEAFAQIGDPSSIPFLLIRLKEPSQKLRIITAAALLKCLYS